MHSWISTQATDGWDEFERREGEEHGPMNLKGINFGT